ncbi:MAG: hypothetical protein SGILL_007346 [Bacillariaceae sp.]
MERVSYWFDKIQSENPTSTTSETWNAYLRTLVRHAAFDTPRTQETVESYSSLTDGYTYSIIVRGWMESHNPDSADKAYEALQRGISYCMKHSEQTDALHQLLFDYFGKLSRNDNKDDFVQSVQVLQKIISLQQSNPELSILHRKHFVTVMSALASRGEAKKVGGIFRSMQELYEQGHHTLEPDYQTLTIVMSALAKTQNAQYSESIDTLLSLIEEQILTTRTRPSASHSITNHAYNIVLDFFSRVSGLTERRKRIEALMCRMEEWANHLDNQDLLPDRISYASLLRSIILEKKDGFALEIDKLVKEMGSSDRSAVHPDVSIYSLVLYGFLQSGDSRAVQWAERLKEQMSDRSNILPDEIFYTQLMKIHALYGDAESSDSILSEMIRAFEGGQESCRPTELSFVSAMTSWERTGRTDAPDAALRIFNCMMAFHEKGNSDCRPGKRTFGQLMVILAKSEYKAKREIARRLLSKMKELGIVPDRMVLNWYIRVCGAASSSEKERVNSWKDIQVTLKILRGSGSGANSHTYNSILHACPNLFVEEEECLAKVVEVFEKCKNDGLVDRRIIGTLKRLLSAPDYEQVTTLSSKDPRTHLGRLPREWQRNKRIRQ